MPDARRDVSPMNGRDGAGARRGDFNPAKRTLHTCTQGRSNGVNGVQDLEKSTLIILTDSQSVHPHELFLKLAYTRGWKFFSCLLSVSFKRLLTSVGFKLCGGLFIKLVRN